MTTEECYELRRQAGFITPISPLERGQMFCTFATRGAYEWLIHPADVHTLIARGMLIDGEKCEISVGEDWPYMNAVMIRAVYSVADTYIDPTKA
jgi:hypothetical protein